MQLPVVLKLVLLVVLVQLASGFRRAGAFVRSTTRRSGLVVYNKPVAVTFEPTGKKVEALQGDLISDVASKAKVTIPFKCKQGRCGSCEVRINGRVSAKVCQGAKIPAGPTKAVTISVVNKKPL